MTGTRLRLPDYKTTNAVTSVTSEQIRNEGVTNLTDFLQQFPALTGSVDLEDNASTADQASVGLTLLDLRNLGSERTLVLVNGRRHVAGAPGSAAVDINTIPIALIDRVEIQTGGASAVYGADGVSGVVNFVLKRNFEGLDVRVQYGAPEQAGGETFLGSAVAGANFDDDKGNVTVAVEIYDLQEINRDDRDYARSGNRETLVNNPGTNPSETSTRVFRRDVRYIDSSRLGAVYTDNDFTDTLSGVDFTGDGNPWADGIDVGDFSMIGGSGTRTDEYVDQLLPGQDRQTLNLTGAYDFSRAFRLSGELKYVQTHTAFVGQPTFDFFVPILPDNAFIPAPILADASQPGALFDTDGALYVTTDNFGLGNTAREIDRQTFRGVLAADGDITDWLQYNLSVVYGRTQEDSTYINNRINERWFAAIDAVDDGSGNIVCRSDLDPTALPPGFEGGPADFGTTFTPGAGSGCIPINIFGGQISPAAAAWVNTNTKSKATIQQTVVTGFLTGDTTAWFELPAGPISYVAGAEYRLEKSKSIASKLELDAADAGYDITWGGQGTNTIGDFDVWEVFGEASVPLIANEPAVKEFRIDGAVRYSDYSTSGPSISWKAGAQWRIDDNAMFRSTVARAVRAPNISELFLPNTQTFAGLIDPCDNDQIDLDPDRAINCVADGMPVGFNDTNSASVEGRVGGNLNLKPEKGDTFTAGFVYTPTYLKGFMASVDYYEIELTDAINFFDAQTILDYCYDLPRPNQFCALVSRDPTTFLVDGFEQIGVNVSAYKTKGWDFTMRYRLDPQNLGWVEDDIGAFNFTLVANRLNTLAFTLLQGEEPDEHAGDAGAPQWQATFDLTWAYEDWQVNYGYQWQDETYRASRERLAIDPNYNPPGYNFYSDVSVHDLQVRYQVSPLIQIYGGVNNFTNQEPDRGLLDTPVNPVGRFFYLGATARLGSLTE